MSNDRRRIDDEGDPTIPLRRSGARGAAPNPRLDDVLAFSIGERAIAPRILFGETTPEEVAAARLAAAADGPLGPRVEPRPSFTSEIDDGDILESIAVTRTPIPPPPLRKPIWRAAQRVCLRAWGQAQLRLRKSTPLYFEFAIAHWKESTAALASFGIAATTVVFVANHRAEPKSTPEARAPLAAAAAKTPVCVLSSKPRMFAKRAVVGGGIEVTSAGPRLALGVAMSQKAGLALEIDAASGSMVSTAKVATQTPMRRLFPTLTGETVNGFPDADTPSIAGLGTRIVLRDGLKAGNLVERAGELAWAEGDTAKTLWVLPAAASKSDSLQTAPLGADEFMVAIRRDGALWVGSMRGTPPVATGPLVRVSEASHEVGAPTLTAQSGAAVLAWADRARGTDPFRIVTSRWHPGKPPSAPRALPLGNAPPTTQAMSPSIASAGPLHVFVTWTEGGASRHLVRGQLVDDKGSPAGAPLLLSEESADAGQPHVVLDPTGRGVVAYFVADGPGYALSGTPVACVAP